MASRSDPARTAEEILALAGSRGATLGAGRLICLDGPAGSGKTTLAAALAQHGSEVRVVHMDDLYDGWDGLPRVARQLETVLGPLGQGRVGRYRRYDWLAGGFAETVVVPPSPWLVIEGVGAGLAAYADLHTVLVWVTAPEDLRRRRWREREGSDAWWDHWRAAEQRHFAADATIDRADLLVET
jgi:chloramphenicol 3-O-phosphotransferase